ncbi:MAG: tol-pal system protein YbgF [Deltaproteobacteria bacterium]|nr:tol-pal system protein YbgF [Deltaproteobacteria bacterium]
MKKTTILICGFAWTLGGAGCGETSNQTDLSRLKKRVEELSQKLSVSTQQVESANNRLFLLEDKVDTSRVALQRQTQQAPLHLPVIRIRPEDVAEPPSRRLRRPQAQPQAPQVVSSLDSRAGGRSVVAHEDVEYAGEAARKHVGRRPILRLHGADGYQRRASPTASRPLSGPDPSTVRERLPVVAMPKRKVARAMAKAPPATADAMRSYNAALARHRAGQHKAAAKAFKAFVSQYPRHAYTDNALYWLGECHYDQGNFRQALNMFRRCVEKHPNGNKAPAALLKMGFSYLKLNEKHNARIVLAQVMEIFPRSGVARLASATLSKLQKGHGG